MTQEPIKIAIIGTGAVGGYYGGLLQQSGNDVHFLLHNDYEHVQKLGLRIESPNGDFLLSEVKAYNDPAKMPPCDLIVIALKTTENQLLPSLLPPLIDNNSSILTLQNGIGGEEQIANLVGASRVVGGLCFLCCNKISPGHICHLDYGLITLGAYRADQQPAGITSRIEQIGELLRNAGISIDLIPDLPLARWKKLVWNIPFNGLAVVENTLTDTLVKNMTTRQRCVKLMHEVAAAAAACARPIEPDFIEKMMTYTERMKPYAPSMKLDYDRGRPMEIESIYGNPLRMAQSCGISMPETEKLYHQLLALNPSD